MSFETMTTIEWVIELNPLIENEGIEGYIINEVFFGWEEKLEKFLQENYDSDIFCTDRINDPYDYLQLEYSQPCVCYTVFESEYNRSGELTEDILIKMQNKPEIILSLEKLFGIKAKLLVSLVIDG